MLSSAPRDTSRSSLITGRPPERFDATTVAGSPSTRRVAPLANRCASSLACSTKNDPSSPCGLPTRPTLTSSDKGLEVLCRFAARWGATEVFGKACGVLAPDRFEGGDRSRRVGGRPAEVDVRAEQ